MKRIFIASPFAGPTPEAIAENVALARRLCADALANGDAPYAPHLLMPQFLVDADPIQRATGIAAGQAFLAVCDEVWCWSMAGGFVSSGMESDLTLAIAHGIPVLYPWGKPGGLRPLDPDECDAFVTEAVAHSPLDGEVREVPVTTPESRVTPVDPMPDDWRDTDNLDADVADFVKEVDDAIALSWELPSKADDFASSVREKLESIREWCVSNNAMTEAQEAAVGNMEGGMRRWVR